MSGWRRIVVVGLAVVLGGGPAAAATCAALCAPSTTRHHATPTVEQVVLHHHEARSLPSTASPVVHHDEAPADASDPSRGKWGAADRLHDCCAPTDASVAAATPSLRAESRALSFVNVAVWLPRPSTSTMARTALFDVLPTPPLRSRARLVLRV